MKYLQYNRDSNESNNISLSVARFAIFCDGLLWLDQNTNRTVNRCIVGWGSLRQKQRNERPSLILSPNVLYFGHALNTQRVQMSYKKGQTDMDIGQIQFWKLAKTLP